MRLTKNNLAFFLTDRGFLDQSDLINGNYVLSQSKSRNSIFLVSRGKKKGLFVKQLVTMDSENAYLMQKDATAHYLIHNYDSYKEIRKYIPNYYGYDPKNYVFVTEYFPNAHNMYEWSIYNKKLSIDHAIEIALILDSFHHDISKEIPKNSSLQFFNKALPWILNLPGMNYLQNDIVFNLILEDSFLSNQLDELRRHWSGNSLVHGDIKLVNFMIVNKQNKDTIKLIDWEISNIGDQLWDVAGFLQSYLFTWLTNTADNQYEPVLHQGYEFLNLTHRKEVLFAFWEKYKSSQNWTPEESEVAVIKTMKYVGARLLQSARELNQFTPNNLLPKSNILIKMAKNIFQSPEKTAKELIGITK